MRFLILASLFASFAAPAQTLLSQAPGSTAADDEDEDDPVVKPNLTPTPGAEAAKPAPEAPAVAPVVPAVASPDAQKLVSGAPLSNPNVAVHIVEKKAFSDKGKFEAVLYPAAVQANGKFTQHFGTGATFVYHLHENFGFQVSGQYNWFASESAFNGELINKVRQEAQAATSLLLVGGALGGVEVTPLYGKFAWYADSLAHFSLVLNGGVGMGWTRHQLKPASDQTGPATFGDTGPKFMGSLGAGFRLQLGDRFAVRLEVRDLVYTARTDKVNGCDGTDLDLMDRTQRGGGHFFNPDGSPAISVSASCKLETYDGVDEATGLNRGNDVPLARNLVINPSSDVLNNVGLYLGFSFLF
ncbi:MAG: outer membrane beta-barrel domain-containing protein [Myxococcaceae bacterium]